MRGESHLTASILMALPTSVVLFNLLPANSIEAVLYVLGGIVIGCLLPDVDASDAKVMHDSWRPIGLFGKYVFYKPMTWLLRSKSDAFHEQHRGYLHSLLGCLLAAVFFAIPVSIVFLYFTFVEMLTLEMTVLFWFLWIGIPLGFLMHLAEDSFTKSGVRWFFPRGKTYSGQTSTGKRSEYNLLTAFLMLFGLFTVYVLMQVATIELLAGTIVGSLILLGILYAINPLISRFSR